MDYEEMLLQISDVLRKYNHPYPYISSEKAIEEIRKIVDIKVVKECCNCKYYDHPSDCNACKTCEGTEDPSNWTPLEN